MVKEKDGSNVLFTINVRGNYNFMYMEMYAGARSVSWHMMPEM